MRRNHVSAFGRGLERLETRENPSGFGSLFTFSPQRFVTGTVYADANANGTRDAGEGGVNGLTVYLDANNNGSRDASEPSVVTGEAVRTVSQNGVTTTTREPGYYLLSLGRNVPAGAVVRVDGATQTTPPAATPTTLFAPPVDFGVSGVVASPPSAPPVTTTDTTSTGGTASTSGSVSVSSSGTGSSSSAFVSSSSSSGSGSASVSVTSSFTGNSQVWGSATAGDLTIYVG